MGISVLLIALSIAAFATYESKKTPRDLLELGLVAITVAIFVFSLNRAQRQRELGIANDQRERDYELAKEQRDQDRELANQGRPDTALQEYLSQTANLLIDQKLLDKNGDPLKRRLREA